jgi:AraC-like DNA-binding protein
MAARNRTTGVATSGLREFEQHIAGRYLEHILALVVHEPPDRVQAAFATAGLDYNQLRRAPPQLHSYDLYALLHALNRDDCCPGICLRFGLARDLLDLGVLGYTVLSCRDLGTAIQVVAKYHRLTSDAFELTLTSDEDWTVVRQWVKPQHVRHRAVIDEEHVTGIWRVIASLMPAEWTTTRMHIQFAHAEPPYGELYRELMPCKQTFSAAETFIAFPTAWGKLPIQTADQTVEEVCESQCDLVLNELDPAGSLVDDLRRLILTVPANRAYKLEDYASKMLMSTRTLERRLAAAGTSYRNVDNEIRMHQAAQYLALGYLSNQQIADILNYSQPSTFYRAFKSWQGITPNQYRENLAV